MCSRCDALAKAIDRYIQKVDDDLADELTEEGFEAADRTVDAASEIEDGVAEALTDETDYIIREAESCDDLNEFWTRWEKVQAADETASALAAVFEKTLSRLIPDLCEEYLTKTDRSLKLTTVSKRTTAWVKSWSSDLADLMKLTSHQQIETILTEGLEAGDGIGEFIVNIQQSGIRNEYYRARRVAITEVLRAHSVAQQESFMQSPSVTKKMWKHSGAYRIEPRWNHQDFSGTAVDKDKEFALPGADGITYYCMYPRDTSLPAGESINCHCVCQPVVDEDILGMPLEERQKMQQEAIDNMDDEWEKELDARNRAKGVPV